MCTIDKMLIRGIRSFAPENNATIVFYKPLTLIVGSNGAGKTTIIECLKQACTGELPPNVGGNGRNWVMDPKVYGEAEVKAQIKLLMTTGNKMPVVVIRSYQSVQKKSGQPSFKTLDSTIQTKNKDTGKKEAITYRCADINAMVPNLMQVSKAVLDNVIFVHQEESLWPLADGATIKKKFDEIFAATKYTKALESLQKLKKEKVQDSKEMKLKLETLKSHKDAAQKLQQQVHNGNAQVQELNANIALLETRLHDIEAEMESIDTKLASMASLLDEVTRVKAQAEVVARAARDKLHSLPSGDYEETDEELERFAADFEQNFDNIRATRDDNAQRLKTKQIDQASYDDRIQAAQQQLSRLQAAGDAHASNVAARDNFVRSTAAKMGIELPGGSQSAAAAAAGPGQRQQQQPLPPAAVEFFKSELLHQEGQLQSELGSLREAHRAQETALTGQIDGANAALANAQQAAKMKEQDLQQLERRRDNLHQQVMLHTSAPFQAGELQAQQDELSRKLEGKKAEEARHNFDAAMTQQRAEIEKLHSTMATLRQERDRVIMADDVASRLRTARNNLAASTERYQALLLGAPAKRLLELIGNPSPLPHGAEIKRRAETAVRTKEQEVFGRREALKDLEKSHAAVEAELTSKRRERVRADTKVQELRSDLRRGLSRLAGPFPMEVNAELNAGREEVAFQAALTHMQTKRTEVFNNVKRAEAAATVLTFFGKQSRDMNCCMLCKRDFTSEEELETLMNCVTEMQDDFPQRKAAFDSELEAMDQQIAALNNLLGSEAALKDVEAGLPRLREAEGAAAAAADHKREEVEALGEQVALLEAEITPLRRALGEAGWALAKQNQEVDELTAAVEKASAAAAAAGSTAAASRDREDIDADLQAAESQLRHAEIARDDLVKRHSKIKDERVRLSEQLAAVMAELRQATEANRQRQELNGQLKDVTEQITQLTEAIKAASAAVGPAKAQRDDLLAKRDGLRQQQLAAEGQLESRLRAIAVTQDGLAAKQRPIDEYNAGNTVAQQQKIAAELEQSREKRDAAARDVQQIQMQLEGAVRQLAEREATKMEIEVVRDYRRTRHEQERLDAQLNQLQQQIAQIGSRADLQKRHAELAQMRQDALQQSNQHQGSLNVVQQNMREAKQSLRNARYHQINERYRKQLVELKTTDLAASDLNKYHKALERALLAFHTGKMADINKIIKELWQKTYRGQDIDYIQLKADADQGVARNYNYRVVMVNGGVEMDMRGRCSAGQKVLACLIIRLALAETFCLNCGILALDEPTTNLDAENSASLAEALRALMVARREQDNFQLIIITHDEHFAHLIGTRQHAEYLWRITKDENQRSFIQQEEIVE